MRVLLLGATGRVGSRLLPALRAHNHEVIAYVRNPSKMSQEAKSAVTTIVSGSGTESASIKSAITSNDCDAVVNAAGLAPALSKKAGDFPDIFAAVVKAAIEAKTERGGRAVRCWFLSGWTMLDSPKLPNLILDYMPLFPSHKPNYDLIRQVPTDELPWSLFCASNMPFEEKINYSPKRGNNLISGSDSPPELSETMLWVPIVGTYLNIMVQAGGYAAPLEDCVDFIASDLAKGLQSEYVGKRVGVKVKPKQQ